ncbi:FxsA family protein [Halopseudomonas pachastrellae]|nr:FxsA family protein [Halopseudomonas pachastrellae]
MPLFRFLLLLLPFMELASLILLGQRIGVGATLLWVLGTGLLGLVLIQRQGWSMLQQLQIRMAENRSPFAVLKTGMWWLLAGVLLMIPGLITDTLAVACLVMAWFRVASLPLVSRAAPQSGVVATPPSLRVNGSRTIRPRCGRIVGLSATEKKFCACS